MKKIFIGLCFLGMLSAEEAQEAGVADEEIASEDINEQEAVDDGNLSPDEIQLVFNEYDKDGDKLLDPEEIISSFTAELESMIEEVDPDEVKELVAETINEFDANKNQGL